MVIAVNNLKSIEMKGRSFLLTLAFSTSLSVSIAGEMPTGASVPVSYTHLTLPTT